MADPVWESLVEKRRRMGHKKGGRVAGAKSRPRLDKESRGGPSSEEQLKKMGKYQGDQETPWNYAKGGSIKIKPSHKGLLHKELGVKSGEKIPEKKLEKAKNSSDPAERKRATFAENAKHWKKK